MIKLVLFIIRECLVNLLGYKLGLRKILGRGKLINVTGDVDKDINDKGAKHRSNVAKILDELDLHPKKGRFLEMGPGGLLLHGCMVVLDGWDEYIAVDAYTSEVWSDYPIGVLESYSKTLSEDKRKIVREIIKLKDKNSLVRYYGINGVFNEDLNKHVGEKGVDFIYTWGVLEHVEDIFSVLKKNYELLSDDGIIVHVIDTHPHTWSRFSNPYVFLTISDWLWNLMYGGRGFISRLMPGDYISAAEQAGFKVTIFNREVDDCDISNLRWKFLDRFRKFPDEEILTHRIYAVMRK